jgi:hypothetical protein
MRIEPTYSLLIACRHRTFDNRESGTYNSHKCCFRCRGRCTLLQCNEVPTHLNPVPGTFYRPYGCRIRNVGLVTVVQAA